MTQTRMSIPPSAGSLPTFKIKRVSATLIKVICPYCKGWFIVNWRKWASSMPEFDTRSCTHCFRTSYIRKHHGKHHAK